MLNYEQNRKQTRPLLGGKNAPGALIQILSQSLCDEGPLLASIQLLESSAAYWGYSLVGRD